MDRLRGSLAAQVAAAMLLVDVLLLAVGVVGLASGASLNDRLASVATRDLVPLSHARVAQNMNHSIVITNFAAAQTPDKAVKASLLDLNPKYLERMQEAFTALKETVPAELKPQVTDLVSTYTAFAAADADFRANPAGAGVQERADKASTLFVATDKAFDTVVTALMKDADQQKADVQAAYRRNQVLIIGLIVLGLAVGAVLVVVIARTLRQGTTPMLAALERLAEGDLTSTVTVQGRSELAQMGSALNRGLASVRAALSEVATVSASLAGSASALTGSAEDNARAVQGAASGIDGVLSSSQRVTYSVDAAASSTRELSMSIREIAENATRAAQVAGDAVDVVQATNATISQLGNSSQEIGNVIQVIQNIAAQTSLLALNATIEAARAGDAGRGFAVVAGEVKDLARETAEATESVINRVQAIQADTEGAVHAIGEIGEIIEQINAFQGTIASAVEEQSVTTESLSAGISSALDVTRDIESQIQTVAGSAQTGAGAVDATRSLASDVAAQGRRLQDLVGTFRL